INNNTVANTGRNILSGILALRWLPIQIPGSEPIKSVANSVKFTLPKVQCPAPANAVSGIACARSVPTTLMVGKRGYRKNNATVPKAPAPTDDKVTRAPSTTPTVTVTAGCHLPKRPSLLSLDKGGACRCK